MKRKLQAIVLAVATLAVVGGGIGTAAAANAAISSSCPGHVQIHCR